MLSLYNQCAWTSDTKSSVPHSLTAGSFPAVGFRGNMAENPLILKLNAGPALVITQPNSFHFTCDHRGGNITETMDGIM